jgi:hypothetical protein
VRRASGALLSVALLTAACGPVTNAATGIVVSVDQASLTDVRSFTLRTETGDTLSFRVGQLDLSEGAFPANHLREHMATAIPVTVTYTGNDPERVAVRLIDAPQADQ